MSPGKNSDFCLGYCMVIKHKLGLKKIPDKLLRKKVKVVLFNVCSSFSYD